MRALGGSDRALVWRGNPYFECPPAGNLNEFELHLSVSRACLQVLLSCFTTTPFCNFVSHPNGEWSTVCKVIHTNFTAWLHTRTEIRNTYFLAIYKMSACLSFEKYSYIYFITWPVQWHNTNSLPEFYTSVFYLILRAYCTKWMLYTWRSFPHTVHEGKWGSRAHSEPLR